MLIPDTCFYLTKIETLIHNNEKKNKKIKQHQNFFS